MPDYRLGQSHYEPIETFSYNAIWLAGFFLFGLQFTHIDHGFMTKFVLDYEKMKEWPIVLWIVLGVVIVIIIALVSSVMIAYH